MFAIACSALFSKTLAYLSDFSKHRTRYSFDCWTFALRWRFADAKTMTCCVRDFVTTFVCRLFHSLNNILSSDTWCFSKSSSFLESRFFYREAKKRRRWRDFFSIKRLLNVDIEFFERRLLYIFEIYRMQNRFRASYVRNFIFLDYFDLALKQSNRMIVFTINTFFLVDQYLAR